MVTNDGINYKLVASDVTYPLVDTLVREETVEGEFHLEQVYLEDGKPDIEIILDEDGNAVKKPKFIEIAKTRKIIEAVADLEGVPDGVAYEVLAWDSNSSETDAITLKFHIGRAVFEHVTPDERAGILHKEIEIKYLEARSSWLEGLELVAGDAK